MCPYMVLPCFGSYLTAGPSWLCAYPATRVVGPSPPRSRESWCPRVRTVPRSGYSFSPAGLKPITLAPEFVDRCTAGEPVWAGNADSKRLGHGQGDDRQPDSVRRAAGGSVILSAAQEPLRFVVNMHSKFQAGEPCSYFFTAMACNSKCPPRRSDPAPMNSRAGKSLVVK